MAQIRVLALDVQGGQGLHEIMIDNHDLDAIYKELKCDTFDVAVRKIGGRYFYIFCDDEGLYKESPIISAIDSTMHAMLVGNLLFANCDTMGETVGLTDEDVDIIKKSAINLIDESGQFHTAIFSVEY